MRQNKFVIVPFSIKDRKPISQLDTDSSRPIGRGFLCVDYTIPIQAIKEELRRILEDSDKWDDRVGVLQVTNANERMVELRALMSAADSSSAWELRLR